MLVFFWHLALLWATLELLIKLFLQDLLRHMPDILILGQKQNFVMFSTFGLTS